MAINTRYGTSSTSLTNNRWDDLIYKAPATQQALEEAVGGDDVAQAIYYELNKESFWAPTTEKQEENVSSLPTSNIWGQEYDPYAGINTSDWKKMASGFQMTDTQKDQQQQDYESYMAPDYSTAYDYSADTKLPGVNEVANKYFHVDDTVRDVARQATDSAMDIFNMDARKAEDEEFKKLLESKGYVLEDGANTLGKGTSTAYDDEGRWLSDSNIYNTYNGFGADYIPEMNDTAEYIDQDLAGNSTQLVNTGRDSEGNLTNSMTKTQAASNYWLGDIADAIYGDNEEWQQYKKDWYEANGKPTTYDEAGNEVEDWSTFNTTAHNVHDIIGASDAPEYREADNFFSYVGNNANDAVDVFSNSMQNFADDLGTLRKDISDWEVTVGKGTDNAQKVSGKGFEEQVEEYAKNAQFVMTDANGREIEGEPDLVAVETYYDGGVRMCICYDANNPDSGKYVFAVDDDGNASYEQKLQDFVYTADNGQTYAIPAEELLDYTQNQSVASMLVMLDQIYNEEYDEETGEVNNLSDEEYTNRVNAKVNGTPKYADYGLFGINTPAAYSGNDLAKKALNTIPIVNNIFGDGGQGLSLADVIDLGLGSALYFNPYTLAGMVGSKMGLENQGVDADSYGEVVDGTRNYQVSNTDTRLATLGELTAGIAERALGDVGLGAGQKALTDYALAWMPKLAERLGGEEAVESALYAAAHGALSEGLEEVLTQPMYNFANMGFNTGYDEKLDVFGNAVTDYLGRTQYDTDIRTDGLGDDPAGYIQKALMGGKGLEGVEEVLNNALGGALLGAPIQGVTKAISNKAKQNQIRQLEKQLEAMAEQSREEREALIQDLAQPYIEAGYTLKEARSMAIEDLEEREAEVRSLLEWEEDVIGD